MMAWNYRVLRYWDGEVGLHEVYYGADGEPDGHTERPCGFVGETVWGLRWSMLRALRDTFKHPVMDDPDTRYTITPAGRAMLEGEGK